MIKSDAPAQVVEIRADDDQGLLSSTLDSAEFADHWEWLCYTKPIGPGVRIVVKQGCHRGFQVTSTGTHVESSRTTERDGRVARHKCIFLRSDGLS
jgi:hypothetical protein